MTTQQPGQPGQKASYWDRIKPWNCATCGKANISANYYACPQCQTPRPGSAEEAAEQASGTLTRVYEGE